MSKFKFKPKKMTDLGSTNGERAARAGAVLDCYNQLVGEPASDGRGGVADLIADLGHFCDRQGHDFEASIRMANGNWEEER